jgi:hypothetical protein
MSADKGVKKECNEIHGNDLRLFQTAFFSLLMHDELYSKYMESRHKNAYIHSEANGKATATSDTGPNAARHG